VIEEAKGTGIDIRGRAPISKIIENEFDTWTPWFVRISVEELLRLGEGKPSVSEEDPEFLVAKTHARRLARELNVCRSRLEASIQGPVTDG